MKSTDSVIDALAGTPAYAHCEMRELRLISRASTRIEVAAGAVLATAGRGGHEFVIVLTGSAAVRCGEAVVAIVQAGDHFGELAMINGGPSPVTVTAMSPMALAVVGPGEFDALVAASPTLARAIMRGLTRRDLPAVAA